MPAILALDDASLSSAHVKKLRKTFPRKREEELGSFVSSSRGNFSERTKEKVLEIVGKKDLAEW